MVANDPITGQGANGAAKAAAVHLESILAHGDRPFDRDFQQAVADRVREGARPVVQWTSAMLEPAPEHLLGLLVAAAELPSAADRFANGFDAAADFGQWFPDPEGAADHLASLAPRG
ncbi:hypothetical protein ACF9IK_31090 [Kitasatospora hibisci]|uniref:hypothetical protein n=1 Tax=Kitasatospora hibisci TaxID=3369522 RepID=UPI003754D0B9